jgi:hypothetical protein
MKINNPGLKRDCFSLDMPLGFRQRSLHSARKLDVSAFRKFHFQNRKEETGFPEGNPAIIGRGTGWNKFLNMKGLAESMYFIQVVAVLFALFAFSRVLLRLKEKKLSILEFLFWTCIWLGLILVALFPEKLSDLAKSLGIQSGTGLAVYLGVVLSFYLIFRLYVKLDTIEQQITILNRALAIKAAERGRKKRRR